MTWLKATFSPTSLFSLKPSWATSTGGKTLLVPSPYSIKMALLDAVLRTEGLDRGTAVWPIIRDLKISMSLPKHLVVTNLFTKVLKIRRNPAAEGSADAGPFQKSIGYREYVFLSDDLTLMFEIGEEQLSDISKWLTHVTYLGKRGGFMQLRKVAQVETLDSSYTHLTQEAETFQVNGLMQQLEDCDPKMKFDEADIYSSKRPKRITRSIILPFKISKSSRSYTMYEHL
jgi:hypothetical protein